MCVLVHVCVCVCVLVHVCAYVCACICACAHVPICVHLCACVCMCVCVSHTCTCVPEKGQNRKGRPDGSPPSPALLHSQLPLAGRTRREASRPTGRAEKDQTPAGDPNSCLKPLRRGLSSGGAGAPLTRPAERFSSRLRWRGRHSAESGLPSLLGRFEAATQPRHPPLSWGRPGTLTFLVGHGG